jgi:hypothetical protein
MCVTEAIFTKIMLGRLIVVKISCTEPHDNVKAVWSLAIDHTGRAWCALQVYLFFHLRKERLKIVTPEVFGAF